MVPELAFNNPQAFWLLLLVPLVIWRALWERRRRAALRFSVVGVFAGQRRGLRAYLLWILPLLQLTAIVVTTVALARPQERDTRVRDLSVEGIDIVIALDLSTSMEAADFRPLNRLNVAKDVLSAFVSSRLNDRIGLVVFAGQAFTQAPLTLDYGVLREVVRQLRTRVLPDGTAIGDAVATALNRLRDSDAKSRVVILITDGDNNSGKLSPMDAAAMGKSLGIPVFTILVGKGGKVPFPAGVDLFGNPAYTTTELPVNPELLKQIARVTGGDYFRATDKEELEQGLQKVLDSMERSKILEGGASATYREQFHPFLLLGFLLLLLELVMANTLMRVFP